MSQRNFLTDEGICEFGILARSQLTRAALSCPSSSDGSSPAVRQGPIREVTRMSKAPLQISPDDGKGTPSLKMTPSSSSAEPDAAAAERRSSGRNLLNA
ncbi:hypothetical protein VTJ49DRAFT_6236 [Mycothermus thermophilus]|uniref:Uncharacterized protein n=1 Tax=Humicola insolens TaxID=85995 RepID=A0ABR3VJX3_HUMIN